MSITYFECVSAALVIQHAMRIRHVVICGLPRFTIFRPRYLMNGTILENKKKITEHKMCVFLFTLQICLKYL